VDILFVCSENNSSDILTKNVPEKLLATHATRIRDGTLQCREDWFILVEAIEEPDESMNHVQWEDVKIWITDEDRWSEMTCTVLDEYLASGDSFDNGQNKTVYVN
jgi:hypothetical protein